MQSFVDLAAGPHEFNKTSNRPEPVYHLEVWKIDLVVYRIFEKASANSAFFTNRFNSDARLFGKITGGV
jgi:hypothetical protein